MRDPKDWLGSWYRDGQRDDVEQDRSTRGISFDDFVQAYCAPGPRPSFADVGSQAEFLGGTGPARVDRLFRYEDISGFLEFLEDRLGCEIILPRLNVSPLGNTNLSAPIEARLREVCAADFTLYQGLARA
jgi:hypothetical protein